MSEPFLRVVLTWLPLFFRYWRRGKASASGWLNLEPKSHRPPAYDRIVVSLCLMSIPGIGAITATSFVAAIEDPGNLKKSRSVGAWVGLTMRRYQSGEVDYDGHISRRGDKQLRWLLYEAASTILTRVSVESNLRSWGLGLRKRIGFKRAAVAVARKLAVIMHAMLKSGAAFDPGTSPAT